MALADVQSLVLRKAPRDRVAHLLLRVDFHGGAALSQLKWFLDKHPLSVGDDAADPAETVRCTLGFTYRGLEALCVPLQYLRVFARLAPAFADGAPLRGIRLGDTGASSPAQWREEFSLDNAHALLTLHGPKGAVAGAVQYAQNKWTTDSKNPAQRWGLVIVGVLEGELLGHPVGEEGEWVHFGYRDGETQHHVAGIANPPSRSIGHAPGEFLLGHPNDAGFNPFLMPLAPEPVRRFYVDSSFAVLRAMQQDVTLFEDAVKAWAQQAIDKGVAGASVAWVKAKLCGRWPSGERVVAGSSAPTKNDLELDFKNDKDGTGCPWAAHVRRMNPQQQGDVHQRDRPLVRRGTPYGSANWKGVKDAVPVRRGLYGLFFCASLEDQFEHLLGQWATRLPLGSPDDSTANDPLGGPHELEGGVMNVPLAKAAPLEFTGFKSWTQTLGTMYAWHPSGLTLRRILDQDWVKPEDKGPWL